jgi:hypothetical protein
MLDICIQTSYDQSVQLILKSYLPVVYGTTLSCIWSFRVQRKPLNAGKSLEYLPQISFEVTDGYYNETCDESSHRGLSSDPLR